MVVVLVDLAGLVLPHLSKEEVKEVLGILRPAHVLGMELNRGDRLQGVDQALVGAIIHIAKVRSPARRKGGLINGVPVILRGDHSFPCDEVQRRLVVTAVPVLQLVGARTRSQAKEEIAHADPKDRCHLMLVDLPPEALNGRPTLAWVTGPIGDEDPIITSGF
jgi:hypothetical protein